MFLKKVHLIINLFYSKLKQTPFYCQPLHLVQVTASWKKNLKKMKLLQIFQKCTVTSAIFEKGSVFKNILGTCTIHHRSKIPSSVYQHTKLCELVSSLIYFKRLIQLVFTNINNYFFLF